MATKRKHELQIQRGAVSKIPSFSKQYLDVSSIRGEDEKENRTRLAIPATMSTSKRLKIDTSTPKVGASDIKTFKVPSGLGVRTNGIPSRYRAMAMTRKAVAPPPKPAVVAPATSTTSGPRTKARRPAWDLKGKISDLEENVALLMASNQEKAQECEEKTHLVGNAQTKLSEYQQNLAAKDNLLQEKSSLMLSLENDNRNLRCRLEILEPKLSLATAQLEVHQRDLKVAKHELLKANCELEARNAELKEKMLHNCILEESLAKSEEKLYAATDKLQDCELRLQRSELERRKQHNTILELKGNIRVFCRVRPLLPGEEDSKSCLSIDGQLLTVTKPLEHNESGRIPQNTEFKFDKVFSPEGVQETVFEEISQLVQSALDGFNVCIFAYGQTGSGKTYTMEGPAYITDFLLESDNSELGMIPRAVNQVFAAARSQASQGWQYTMDVSILEIYNEIVKDLLSTSTKSTQVSLQKGMDSAMSTTTTARVTCEREVYALLKRARRNRVVAATSCNEYSSRSHSIFRLKIAGDNEKTDEKCEATLSLVDLAGSERLRELTQDGARLRETKNINKSLSNLGNVIMALAQKADHVPYRNSKLTHILMNSLGGNSKALMFVNISPKEENYAESLNSLRFGTKVNNCNIGTASKVVK